MTDANSNGALLDNILTEMNDADNVQPSDINVNVDGSGNGNGNGQNIPQPPHDIRQRQYYHQQAYDQKLNDDDDNGGNGDNDNDKGFLANLLNFSNGSEFSLKNALFVAVIVFMVTSPSWDSLISMIPMVKPNSNWMIGSAASAFIFFIIAFLVNKYKLF